jgi:hypothetical protein
MLQFAFASLQSFGDLAQGFRLRQVAKQHRYELPPTAKAPRMAFGIVLAHCRLEAVPGDQLENLAEIAAYSFQGEASSAGWIRSG